MRRLRVGTEGKWQVRESTKKIDPVPGPPDPTLPDALLPPTRCSWVTAVPMAFVALSAPAARPAAGLLRRPARILLAACVAPASPAMAITATTHLPVERTRGRDAPFLSAAPSPPLHTRGTAPCLSATAPLIAACTNNPSLPQFFARTLTACGAFDRSCSMVQIPKRMKNVFMFMLTVTVHSRSVPRLLLLLPRSTRMTRVSASVLGPAAIITSSEPSVAHIVGVVMGGRGDLVAEGVMTAAATTAAGEGITIRGISNSSVILVAIGIVSLFTPVLTSPSQSRTPFPHRAGHAPAASSVSFPDSDVPNRSVFEFRDIKVVTFQLLSCLKGYTSVHVAGPVSQSPPPMFVPLPDPVHHRRTVTTSIHHTKGKVMSTAGESDRGGSSNGSLFMSVWADRTEGGVTVSRISTR